MKTILYRINKPFIWFLPVAAAVVTACGGRTDDAGRGMPPPPVTGVEVASRDVEIEAVHPGRARGWREVEVRARVGGILEERLHVEGEWVEKGEPLFRIDPAPYELAVRRAEADVANARAAASQAEREWRRVSGLHGRDAVSDRERDRALAEFELAEAGLATAKAALAEAQLNLDYTTVAAPVAGRASLEVMPEGSLVDRGTLLTTLVQTDPLRVYFSMTGGEAARLRGVDSRKAHLPLPGGGGELSGRVDFIDDRVDPATGRVRARAVFDNPETKVVPGEFVRVRFVVEKLENVFAIDPVAVAEGAEGPRVFVIGEGNTAQSRSVSLGPVVDGRQIILNGLVSGDRLIVNGHVTLKSGMEVRPSAANGKER